MRTHDFAQYREHLGTWNESALTVPVSALTPEGNGLFILSPEEALFIGQPTGGSAQGPTAGVIAFLTLPESQIVVRVPLRWNATSYQGVELGQGIAPDILVQETVADARAGRDATLERALQ